MTANHAHTPSTADIRNAVTRDESDWREAGAQFDRWLAEHDAKMRLLWTVDHQCVPLEDHEALKAAAEQRGAIKALRDAADVLQVDIAISWNRHRGVMFMEDESDPGIAPEEWLKRRADRIAEQEDDE